MITIETEKLKLVKVYLKEIIIIALTYAVIFLFRAYVGVNNDYKNLQQKEIIRAEAQTKFFIDVDLKLLKIDGSIIDKYKTDTTDVAN